MLVPLSKALLESDRCPHLHVATPARHPPCPCVLAALLPFSTVSSSARKSGCAPSAWMAPRQNHRLSKACKALQKLPPPHHCVCSSQLASMRCLQPLTGPPPAWNVLPPATCRAPSQSVLDFGQMPPSPCRATPIILFHVAAYPPSPRDPPLPLLLCRNTYHFLHTLYISFC